MRISLATEGKSEHWVVKHMIQNFFKEKEIFFRQVQPQIFDDTQDSIGGWLEILKFCERTDDIKSALIETDYLVIQIDTDESQNPNFGISHAKQGAIAKTDVELFEDVIVKLEGIIDPNITAEFGSKIIFAVCIHTIECWFLPIYFTNNHKSDIHNCLSTLNKELGRRNLDRIPPKKQKEKRKIVFETILRNWKRRQDIVSSARHNAGFKKFIDSLQLIEDAATHNPAD